MGTNEIFVALDVDTKEQALDIAEKCKDFVTGFKVGPRLCMKYDMSFISELAKQKPVFVDNKYFDIPNTMLASIQATFDAGASFTTIHAQSGSEALTAVAKLETELNQQRPFKVLVVTVLTSFNLETLPINQLKTPIAEQVVALAKQAYACGLKSFVCSAKEVASLRKALPDSYLVTPGIRFSDESAGDQKRVVEPQDAFASGASAIVVGRPIYQSENIQKAAKKYFEAAKV